MSAQGKPEILFVVGNYLGGVAYLNKNIIKYTSLRGEANIRLILVNQTDLEHPRFTDSFGADEEVDFNYASYENKYAVLKRFHKLIGEEPGAIICNDGLEMETIYHLGTKKTVYQIIHDFYNLRLAVKFGAIVDVYIAHTRLFRDVLLSADPANTQAYFLPHGVFIPKDILNQHSTGNLKIVFTGRLEESKGVKDLYQINKLLQKRGIMVEWTIIGRGRLRDFLLEQWKGEDGISFTSPDTNEEVMSLMSQHDLFILPTRFEGSPVTVLEALSTGLVPVVSDLPGGISEIVNEDIGRRIPIGNNSQFAEAIADLHENRDLLHRLKMNARKLAIEQFDIRKTSDNYFKLFMRFAEFKKDQANLPPLQIGFRLDKKWLPNLFVSFVRKAILK